MGEETKIEWADATWNGWAGCTKVSAACDHCYAEALSERFGWAEWGAGKPRHRFGEANWRKPLAWNEKARKTGKRPRVFANSLSDVFDVEAPDSWRRDLFRLIGATPNLTWMLLTKRPKVAAAWFQTTAARLDYNAANDGPSIWPPPNIWIGMTAEHQAALNAGIEHLLRIPAAVRFLSCEPLLGPLDLRGLWHHCPTHDFEGGFCIQDCGDWLRLNWIIAGGESGPHARPSHPDWFRSLRDQCQAAGVPYFHKQNGEWCPGEAASDAQMRTETGAWLRWDDTGWDQRPISVRESESMHRDDQPDVWRVGKARAGRLLDGRTWDEVPG